MGLNGHSANSVSEIGRRNAYARNCRRERQRQPLMAVLHESKKTDEKFP